MPVGDSLAKIAASTDSLVAMYLGQQVTLGP